MTRKILTLAAVLVGVGLLAPVARADGPSIGFGIGVGFGGGAGRGFFGLSIGHRHRSFRPAVVVAAPPVICAPAPVIIARPPVVVHRQVPVYRQVWVPARYETVVVGYERCGFPIYGTVCSAPGHYESVLTGYRCD
jgi:hypothetical protein